MEIWLLFSFCFFLLGSKAVHIAPVSMAMLLHVHVKLRDGLRNVYICKGVAFKICIGNMHMCIYHVCVCMCFFAWMVKIHTFCSQRNRTKQHVQLWNQCFLRYQFLSVCFLILSSSCSIHKFNMCQTFWFCSPSLHFYGNMKILFGSLTFLSKPVSGWHVWVYKFDDILCGECRSNINIQF